MNIVNIFIYLTNVYIYLAEGRVVFFIIVTFISHMVHSENLEMNL